MKPEKLKIAMLGHKRIPSNEGGVEVVVEALSAGLVALGHSVTCYNRAGHHVSGAEHELTAGSVYRGVRLVTVPTLERKGFAAVISSFFAAVRSAFGKYDVVHIHAEGPAFFCWLPKLFGKRVIVTVHGLDWQREKWNGGFASKFIHLGEQCAVWFADEIIVLSENVRQYFLDTYGRTTRFIPNGVSVPALESPRLIAEKWGLSKDSYILYLGRIVPEKGETYLIEAFKQVKTDKKLVIAGGSSDTEYYLRQLRELAAEDERILFTGFVQGQLKDELYSNAYLYTLPSDLEGMPLSLLEAMSYGSCCLVSDIPECAEVVENKAVCFRKSDVEDLRQKLQMLCDQPETVAAYKADAAGFILNKYGWDDVVDKTLALYRGEAK
ncbi:MAG: glycosyltransferase family 4 protein [Eubacteriales bacterium]|nr:glycosyltransferase family 4 protein [Eubacteriales bacterium]